jgi:hypothetical protein
MVIDWLTFFARMMAQGLTSLLFVMARVILSFGTTQNSMMVGYVERIQKNVSFGSPLITDLDFIGHEPLAL